MVRWEKRGLVRVRCWRCFKIRNGRGLSFRTVGDDFENSGLNFFHDDAAPPAGIAIEVRAETMSACEV